MRGLEYIFYNCFVGINKNVFRKNEIFSKVLPNIKFIFNNILEWIYVQSV